MTPEQRACTPEEQARARAARLAADQVLLPKGVTEPAGEHDEEDTEDEEMPGLHVTRRTVVVGVVSVLAILAFLYFVVPTLGDVTDGWKRIEEGDPWWFALAALFSVLSFGGYVLLFQDVYVRGHRRPDRLGLRESYQITMAGLAATRLFAAGGAGGVALTAWALRRSGMSRRAVADRTIAFLVLTYAVYMAAIVVFGLGLRYGVLPGPDPFGMTVVPAIFGLAVIAIVLLFTFLPRDLHDRMESYAEGHGRIARIAAKLSTAPEAIGSGVRLALTAIRERDPALLGAVAYWGFNIAILWACFHALGDAPPVAVVVMGYYVGMLGNLLPLPGGVGGVDGGMIGAFLAFDYGGDAVYAVLAYRILAFWLPTIPGIIAYVQLRRTVQRWKDERVAGRTGTFDPVSA